MLNTDSLEQVWSPTDFADTLAAQPACTAAHHIFGGGYPERRVRIFDGRADAEAEIELRRRYAAQELGIDWNAWIEQRNCSPFSATDPSEGLADEVEKWARGGEK